MHECMDVFPFGNRVVEDIDQLLKARVVAGATALASRPVAHGPGVVGSHFEAAAVGGRAAREARLRTPIAHTCICLPTTNPPTVKSQHVGFQAIFTETCT